MLVGGGLSVVEIADNAAAEAERCGSRRLLRECLTYQLAVYRGLGDVEKVADLEDRIRALTPGDEGEDSDVDLEVSATRAASPDTEDMSSVTESDDDGDGGEEGGKSSKETCTVVSSIFLHNFILRIV